MGHPDPQARPIWDASDPGALIADDAVLYFYSSFSVRREIA